MTAEIRAPPGIGRRPMRRGITTRLRAPSEFESSSARLFSIPKYSIEYPRVKARTTIATTSSV